MNKYGIVPQYIKNQQRNVTKERLERFVKPNILERNFNQKG